MLFDRDLPYKSTSLRGKKALSGAKLFHAFFVPLIEVLLYLFPDVLSISLRLCITHRQCMSSSSDLAHMLA